MGYEWVRMEVSFPPGLLFAYEVWLKTNVTEHSVNTSIGAKENIRRATGIVKHRFQATPRGLLDTWNTGGGVPTAGVHSVKTPATTPILGTVDQR